MIPIPIVVIIAVVCLSAGAMLGVLTACLCVASKTPVANGGKSYTTNTEDQ